MSVVSLIPSNFKIDKCYSFRLIVDLLMKTRDVIYFNLDANRFHSRSWSKYCTIQFEQFTAKVSLFALRTVQNLFSQNTNFHFCLWICRWRWANFSTHFRPFWYTNQNNFVKTVFYMWSWLVKHRKFWEFGFASMIWNSGLIHDSAINLFRRGKLLRQNWTILKRVS